MITKDELKKDLIETLEVFLAGPQFSIKFDQISWGLMRESLEFLRYHKHLSSNFDTNGWEFDFWVKYNKGEDILDISGSLHYGNILIKKAGCWYCHTSDDTLVYDSEFDTMVHIECIKEALRMDPNDQEAKFLSYLIKYN
jgi:hypothetical protein